jgi:hypothetical protein
MADEDRHQLVEAARIRAHLTVSELWLRYVALDGDGDLFDVDGYLAGLLPLSDFDQDVLAVAVNERLEEIYREARVPLSSAGGETTSEAELPGVIAALLAGAGRPRADPSSPPHPPRTGLEDPDGGG